MKGIRPIRPRDSFAQLWARLGIDQEPLVRAPKRAFDNERGPCTMMNANLAEWLEEVQGFDPSQFDYELFSQMTVKQYICQNSAMYSPCYSGYNYRTWIPNLSLVQGMDVGAYNGVLITAGTACPSGWNVMNLHRVEFPNITSWGRFTGAWIEHLNAIQSPFPANVGGMETFWLDLNNTGNLDLNDAMQWTTCIGYYGCN